MNRRNLAFIAALGAAACENTDDHDRPLDEPETHESGVVTETEGIRTMTLQACLPDEQGGLNFEPQPVGPDSVFPAAIGPQGGCHFTVQWVVTADGDLREWQDDHGLPMLTVSATAEEMTAGPVTSNPNWVVTPNALLATGDYILMRDEREMNGTECQDTLSQPNAMLLTATLVPPAGIAASEYPVTENIVDLPITMKLPY